MSGSIQAGCRAANRTNAARAVIAVAMAISLASAAHAATAPIYKCLDAQLGLVYTDQRCKGGEQIDVHSGEADPKAAARLARARDEIDRRAAARQAEERRAAAQKELADYARREREDERKAALATEAAAYDSDALAWYPAYLPTRSSHPRAHSHPAPHSARMVVPGFAPRGPFTSPRS